MIGRAVGHGFATARDFLARGLVRVGVTPNALTITGALLTVAAGVCYAAGAGSRFGWSLSTSAPNAWLLLAGGLLVASNACDMLDGAVARIGGQKTRFGAFLDSTLDRCSDFAVYAGIGLHYAWRQPANITFVLACMVAFANAVMISYTKARAENLIDECPAGYWQRGERSAAILIGTFSYNIPAMLVQQAIWPAFTVLRRVLYTRGVLAGRRPMLDPRQSTKWHYWLRPWLWPRMTVPYDLITILNILWLLFAPVPAYDVLREWLA